MNKSSICYSVARVMCYNCISLDDIAEALKKIPPEEKFDLAVRTKEGRIVRLPINDKNIKLDVVGIFPFKDEDDDTNKRYLELVETKEMTMKNKFIDEVPSVNVFEKLNSFIEPLNNLIESVGGTPLSGWYHTVQTFGDVRKGYPFYIFNMSQKSGNIEASFEHGELKAKIRRFIKP